MSPPRQHEGKNAFIGQLAAIAGEHEDALGSRTRFVIRLLEHSYPVIHERPKIPAIVWVEHLHHWSKQAQDRLQHWARVPTGGNRIDPPVGCGLSVALEAVNHEHQRSPSNNVLIRRSA